MIDPNSKLSIFHDDNGTFSDYTEQAADFMRDEFTAELSATEDYLYIGFYKPISGVYIQFKTPNTNANEFSFEVYDGTSWVAADLTDESLGFTRSGFLFWDRALLNAVEVDSVEKYWVRLRPSADHSATEYRAINIVFSDDTLLKQEFYEIDNNQILPPNETSHISSHVSVRNRIIQKLRNSGYDKYRGGDPLQPRKKKIDQWDLLDIFEFRQAATYMALEKIFFNIADGPDDAWWQKYLEYKMLGEEQFALALASIDQDDDGEEDTDEVQQVKRSTRLVY